MTDVELSEVSTSFVDGAVISVEASSQGKGASGPAIALIVEIERLGTDAGSIIVIGSALFELIHRVRPKFNREPIVEDSTTLGALAAAGAPGDLTGLRFCGDRPHYCASGHRNE